MKKYLLTIILSLFISSVAIARSTGCKEGNCENGFGKWVYTDKTTYEGAVSYTHLTLPTTLVV